MAAHEPALSGLWRAFVEGLVTAIQGGIDEEGIPTEAVLDGVFGKLETASTLLGKSPLWTLKVYRRLIAVLRRRAGE